MCGICGTWSSALGTDSSIAAVERMMATMVARGPDGAGVWANSDQDPVLGHRRLAVECGVPEGAALAAGRARYTSDESQLVAERLRERGARSLIVCSSAAHLPRAAEHYRRLGFTVTALPSDFSTRGAAEGWSWALLVPRGLVLAQVDGVAKKWMGRVAGGG